MKSELIKEVWKPVKNYEGLYEVSSFGRVKSLSRYMNHKSGGKSLLKERILRQAINKKGYMCVALCKNCHQNSFLVHRLVAEAFIPNPDNLPQVNHRNEIKTDNSILNLEWCDNEYNCNYGRHNEKLAKYNIDVFTIDGQFIETWKRGINSLAQKYGISSKSQIFYCLFPYKKKDRPRAYINNHTGNYRFKLHI